METWPMQLRYTLNQLIRRLPQLSHDKLQFGLNDHLLSVAIRLVSAFVCRCYGNAGKGGNFANAALITLMILESNTSITYGLT